MQEVKEYVSREVDFRRNAIGIPIVFILYWKKVRYSNERLETFIPRIGLVLIPSGGYTRGIESPPIPFSSHLPFPSSLDVFLKILEKHLP